MGFGRIEFTTIGRAQDYTTIKHNEDTKAFVDQTNLSNQAHRTAEQQAKTVTDSQHSEWQDKRPDAREKGNAEYFGDGGKKRKKNNNEKTDRVIVKGQGGFDMKI